MKKTVLVLAALIIISFLGFFACNKKPKETKIQDSAVVTAESFFDSTSGWGYRIKRDTTTIIEQAYMPGISGNKGFENEQLAMNTAKLVMQKIKNQQFPPTISKSELDSLGVKF